MNAMHRIILALGAVVLLWLLAPGGFEPADTHAAVQEQPLAQDPRVEAFKKAYHAERSRNYTEAINTLAAVQRLPQDYFLNVRLAWLHYQAGENHLARKQYDLAIQDSAWALEPRIGALLPLIALKRYADVEQLARQALTFDSDNYYVNLRLAFAYRMQEKLSQAEKINQRMLELYPADVSFLMEQALTLSAQKRHEAARAYYRQVQLLTPEDTIANRVLGSAPAAGRDYLLEAFQKAYRYEKAKNYVEAAAALASIQPEKSYEYLLHVRLGWLYYQAGHNDAARIHYDRAVRLAPRAVEPLLGLQLPLLAQKKYADAEMAARQTLWLHPKNYYANLRFAFALRMQLRFADAERINQTMLEMYPSDASFLLEQALTYSGQKRADDARKLYRQVLWMSPNDTIATQALAPPLARK